MLRILICLVALLVVLTSLDGASAQTTTAPAASSAPAAPKPSRVKLTVEKLKEMKAKWATNRPKLGVAVQKSASLLPPVRHADF